MMCVVVRGQFVPCTRVQVDAARDALRYHAVVYVVVRSWTVSDCVADGRDASARCAPGCWVGLFTLVVYYTCLRGASGVRLLTFGQLLV